MTDGTGAEEHEVRPAVDAAVDDTSESQELTRVRRVRARYDAMSATDKVKAGAALLLSAAGVYAVVRWGGSLVRRARR